MTVVAPSEPDHTAITTEYSSAVAFATGLSEPEAIVDELRRSFAHLTRSLETTEPEAASRQVNAFGQVATVQAVWLSTVTHLHEHLGQAIAYARSNQVVPPWSRGG